MSKTTETAPSETQREKEHLKVLEEIYFDPKKPGSFSSAQTLLNETNKLLLANGKPKVPYKTVVRFLRGNETHTLHKEVQNQNYVTNPVKILSVYNAAEADLLSFVDLAEYNEGVKYVLTVMDLRSRYLWFKFQKGKTMEETTENFEKILKEISPNKFQVVRTDRGGEFGETFSKMLKAKKIKYFQQYSGKVKVPLMDRLHRTLGAKIAKIHHFQNTRDILKIFPQVVESYNNTVHKSLDGKTPKEVLDLKLGPAPKKPVLKIPEKRKFKIGDHVRLLDVKRGFVHAYRGRYTYEVFKVCKIVEKPGFRIQYYLESLSGEPILGSVYADEIQLIDYKPSELTRIEKVVGRKKIKNKEYLQVKWVGFPKSENSWIEASAVEDI
jgi:hypothetical protein